MKLTPLISLLGSIVLFQAPQVFAQRTTDVLVIGSKDQEVRLTGSGHYIDRAAVNAEGNADILTILSKEVPGTTSYGEDGYGLFPNISFRGANAGRSSKITLMEDGVLVAPAAYAAPAAYYSPTVFRMDGLEVLKGSSQVLYGPSTTGGVLNYLSTPFRNESTTQYKVFAGTDNEVQLQLNHGDRIGNFSYVIELASRQVDGFKTIDQLATETYDTKQTGHRVIDPMIKLAYDVNGRFDQRFELKLARTEMTAYESYLGLSDEDFKQNPYRRYAGSRFDRIDTNNKRGHLRHYIAFSEETQLTTTAYYQLFGRNWYKLNDVKVGGGAFGEPNPNDAGQRGVLTGTAAGELRVRANNRFYESRGLEQNLSTKLGLHQLKMGWRYHRDNERRKQWQDIYTQDGIGAVTNINRGVEGDQSNEKAMADAWAFYLQDEMNFGKLTVIPGLRFETVKFGETDFTSAPGPELSKSISVFNPGIGLRYSLTDQTTVFAGLYKGSALPGAGDVVRTVDPITKAEASYNFETGIRTGSSSVWSLESTLFYNVLRDMIALESLATGATSSTSIGRAKSYGVEFKGLYDLGQAQSWTVNNPWYLTATWNKAEIDGNYTNSEYLTGSKGNALPYSPEWRLTAGSGLSYRAFSFDLNGTYNGKMWNTGENLAADLVESYFLVDSSLSYAIRPETKISLMVQNVFDKEVMISRTPYGARSGRPQTILLGLQGQF